MDILTLADRVEAGEYHADRFPLTSSMRVNGEAVTFTYTLEDCMQHAQVMLGEKESSKRG